MQMNSIQRQRKAVAKIEIEKTISLRETRLKVQWRSKEESCDKKWCKSV